MKHLIFLIFLVSCATRLPVDNSPNWSDNGRLGVPFYNNCNLSKESNGISGCFLHANNSERAQIRINVPVSSSISFESSNCGNHYFSTYKNEVIINIKDLTIPVTSKICSYAVSVKLHYERRNLPRTFRGRFVLQYLPRTALFVPLTFSYNQKEFFGVGWVQREKTDSEVVLSLRPYRKKGNILLMCNSSVVSRTKFKGELVTLKIPKKNCDYEIAVINEDSSRIELATFIYNEHLNTSDISVPFVVDKLGSYHFIFKDDVAFTMIDNKICRSKNRCYNKKGKDKYTLKAFTSNGRVFYGEYVPDQQKWVIK